jgi:hypothetical protein
MILSLNVSKQIQYALLLTPPLMILIGHYLNTSAEKYAVVNRIIFGILLTLAGLLMTAVIVKWGATDNPGLWQLALLAGGAVLPFLMARLLDYEGATHYRALLLAGIIASTWIYGQRHWYNAAGQDGFEIKQFSLQARAYAPLFIYEKASSRVSFYAGRVVPVIKGSQEIPPLVDKAGQLYLVVRSENPPWDSQVTTAVTATKLAENNRFSLWKFMHKDQQATK